MKKKSLKLDRFWRDMKADTNKSFYENKKNFVESYEQDLHFDKRIKHQLCKTCFYSEGRMSLQAFTTVECGNCSVEMTFSNSDTNAFCDRCSRIIEACKHCGATMD